jgi:hypothetical protein
MIGHAQGSAQTVSSGMQRRLGALSACVQVPISASEAKISAYRRSDYESATEMS